MIEASRVTRSALVTLGGQIFNGTSAAGFGGMKAFTLRLPPLARRRSSSMRLARPPRRPRSIDAVKFGLQDAHLVFGNGNTLVLGEFRTSSSPTLPATSTAVASRILPHVGLQLGNVNCVGRILNVTADSGKTASDSLISQLIEKFPVGYTPDVLYMSRRSAGQLARSRSVTIFSQAGVAPNAARTTPNIASRVQDWDGIPIVLSDNIGITDAIE